MIRYYLACALLVIFGTLASAKDWKGVTIGVFDSRNKPIIVAKDIQCATLEKDIQGHEVLSFRLKKEVTDRLVNITPRNISRKITVVVCGKKVSSPRIADKLSGDKFINLSPHEGDKDCLAKEVPFKDKCEG